jgi:hypothetical protein
MGARKTRTAEKTDRVRIFMITPLGFEQRLCPRPDQAATEITTTEVRETLNDVDHRCRCVIGYGLRWRDDSAYQITGARVCRRLPLQTFVAMIAETSPTGHRFTRSSAEQDPDRLVRKMKRRNLLVANQERPNGRRRIRRE